MRELDMSPEARRRRFAAWRALFAELERRAELRYGANELNAVLRMVDLLFLDDTVPTAELVAGALNDPGPTAL